MIFRFTLITGIFLILSVSGQLPDGWERIGHNVRVMKHQDGTRTLYRRTPGQKTLVKKTIGPDGAIRASAHYFIDDNGNPRSCKIYDAKNTLLFKVSYAYQISTGRLLGERMTYADKVNPKTGQAHLASETRYTYDAQGNRSKPVTITFVRGKTAEEIFGGGQHQSTYPEKTFEDQKFLANPRAEKVGQ